MDPQGTPRLPPKDPKEPPRIPKGRAPWTMFINCLRTPLLDSPRNHLPLSLARRAAARALVTGSETPVDRSGKTLDNNTDAIGDDPALVLQNPEEDTDHKSLEQGLANTKPLKRAGATTIIGAAKPKTLQRSGRRRRRHCRRRRCLDSPPLPESLSQAFAVVNSRALAGRTLCNDYKHYTSLLQFC